MTKLQEFYIYGRRPVLEALEAGAPLEKIYIRYGTQGKELTQIRVLAKRRKIPCVQMDRRKFATLQRQVVPADSPGKAQGVIALRLPAIQWLSIGELIDQAYAATDTPLLVALDHVTDPQNLGAILRTCEAAGVDGVILSQRSTAPITPVVWKTSAGAVEHLRLVRVQHLVQALRDCKLADFQILGTADTGDSVYTDVDLTLPTVLVLGSEHSGIQPQVLAECNAVVRIPLAGRVSSLNVSVACGILVFEAVRQRRAKR